MLCQKQAILDLFSPMAKVTAVTTVFPCTGLSQIPTQSKNSGRSMFHTANAGLLPKSAVFALCACST